MALPDWLAQMIRDRTGLSPGDRYAKRVRCRRCRAHVLAGLDSDWCALDVEVDPEPLTPQTEALARLAGRGTYALRRRDRRLELTSRDHWQIAGSPAGSHDTGFRQFVVLAEHRCEGER